jgi:hypothetical protein
MVRCIKTWKLGGRCASVFSKRLCAYVRTYRRAYVHAYLFIYAHTYQYEFDVFRARKATHAGIAIETSQASQTSHCLACLACLAYGTGMSYRYRATDTACCHLRRRRADCRSIVCMYVRMYVHTHIGY